MNSSGPAEPTVPAGLEDPREWQRIEEDYDALFGRGAFQRAIGDWREDIRRDQANAVAAVQQLVRGQRE